MKTRSILSALLGLALMAGGCASDEFERGGVSPTSPGVHVRLTGAAAPAARTRATVEATDGERTVNSVLAVLFDTHEGFYKTVPATRVGETDEYTFIVEKDGTYDIWLVANASDELRSALEGIEPGTPMENAEGVSCLESIVAGQAPDADGEFLMVSKYSEKVTTRITETQSVGEVHMIRLAARFDLLNKAEGVTVKSITFKNRTVRSAVLTPNTMPTQTDWYEETPYEVNVKGDPENGKPWEEHIYTYENNSVAGDFMRPELTITYTEGDDTQVKTHTVELVDPNSTAGTAMAVKRNNLYRIILTKATKLDFDLEVLDWEEADAIENPDLPLVLPKNVQDSLNRQLLVYDLFTEFNVKSISDDNVVTFYDTNFLFEEDCLASSYYSTSQLRSKKLVGNSAESILTDDSGNEYRLPTQGEAVLLFPIHTALRTGTSNITAFTHVNFQTNITIPYLKDKFEESVYLKNDDNGKPITEIGTNISLGFKGMSCIERGRASSSIYMSDNFNVSLQPKTGFSIYQRGPVYALRFEGTDQYSAYKWELKFSNDEYPASVILVKIKAIPENSNIELYDIIDNHTFWADNYIEYLIPISGYYSQSAKSVNGIRYEGNILTSTNINTNNYYRIFGNMNSISTYNNSSTHGYPLRLVKVNKKSETEDQK